MMVETKIKHKPYGPYERFFKRPLDIVCSLLAIVVFCWLFAIVAILVKVKLGSPVIFCQERPGKDGRIFKLYKFRSMTDARDENGELLPNQMRLTKFGRILRASSLDELPELINILRGDMSIIGPRPLAVQYLPYYNSYEKQRHDVRPGLTGNAQINGRNNLVWEERFRMDVEYVNRITLLGDIKIILQTIGAVVSHKNITVPGIDSHKDFDQHRREQMEAEKTK